MGENPEHVHLTGAPGLDDLLSEEKIPKKTLESKLGSQFLENIILVVQHPVSTSPKSSGKEIRETLKALKKIDGTKIIVYPNGDVGSGVIIDEIEKLRGKKDFIIVKNMSRNIYANILRLATVFVGNSSGGIIETASFGLPTVNIGPRQFGRERNKNVFNVSYNSEEIYKTVKKIISKKIRFSKMNLYGDGNSGKRIVKTLEKFELTPELLQKYFYEKN